MMFRTAAIIALLLAAPGLAGAQTAQDYAQLRLYTQQLEEQVRTLTGQVERLQHDLQLARQNSGGGAPQPGLAEPAGGAPGQQSGFPPQEPGAAGIAQNDPLIAPDGASSEPDPLQGPGGPIDLSTLAGGGDGVPGGDFGDFSQPGGFGDAPGAAPGPGQQPGGFGGDLPPQSGGPTLDGQQAAMAGSPPPNVALSGSPRDAFDLAYGYILAGSYDLAEGAFRNWLAAFPQDQQASDAKFWLGESEFQQGEYRDAAATFLDLYKQNPQSPKAPDALIRLGVSLAQLGEKDAACGTLKEFSRRFPQASDAQKARAGEEIRRADCG